MFILGFSRRFRFVVTRSMLGYLLPLCCFVALAMASSPAAAEPAPKADDDWVVLLGPDGATGFQKIPKQLAEAGDVKLAENGRNLETQPGQGLVVAPGKRGWGKNLVSEQKFGDCRVHLEFMIGGRSNSGVKLQRRYEIQLYDSHGREDPTARDCGGIYPHWKPGRGRLNYLDEGVPPKVNAAKPAGQWQTLDVVFRAPRFNAQGEKTANARLESVVLNGQTIHEDVELESPTGITPHPLGEAPRDALLLQADHGPVAFRNVKVLPLDE